MAQNIIHGKQKGFTLLELMIVIIIMGILYAVANIVISGRITFAKETALKHNLYTIRKAIDEYYTDKNKYPSALQDLVDNKYIRKIPEDPFTKSTNSWIIIPSSNTGNDVFDIKSSCDKVDSNGKPYNEW
ncbi:MAG: type II secretion system protein [Candidatus Firestonebacteria bacterium]